MSGDGIKRRDCFKIAGAGVGLGLMSGMLGSPSDSHAGTMDSVSLTRGLLQGGRKLDPNAGLSVITLGTGTPIPSTDRACAATMVIAGDRAILVDIGRGSLVRMAQAQIVNPTMTLFTHYHSDHFSDFGEMMVTRCVYGAKKKMPVIGPPGAKKVVDGIMGAYELDTRYRVTHHKEKYSSVAITTEVTEAQPSVVYNEAGLKITMFEVNHMPVTPAVGYRFDYKGKSIVVSGDTIKVPKMIEMSQGCDILVHEAMDKNLVERTQAYMDERMVKMSNELFEYHTPTLEVAEIAKEAGVKKLVLTHMVPGPFNKPMARLFTRGMGKIYDGPIKVASDLDEFEA